MRSSTTPQAPAGLRAAVSDLDGTLMGSGERLSSATLGAIEQTRRQGVPFIVATGRTPRAVRRIAGHEHLGTMICANGALTWDPRRDVIVRQTTFDRHGLRAAIEHLQALVPETSFALMSAETMFRDDHYPGSRPFGRGVVRLSDYPENGTDEEIVFVAVRHRALPIGELVGPVSAAFADIGLIALEGPAGIDLVPSGVTKAVAAELLLEEADCHGEATVVFGDMPNDLPLFGWAAWSCAVANAHEAVLAAADEVVPSNDDDGVGVTLLRLFGP